MCKIKTYQETKELKKIRARLNTAPETKLTHAKLQKMGKNIKRSNMRKIKKIYIYATEDNKIKRSSSKMIKIHFLPIILYKILW